MVFKVFLSKQARKFLDDFNEELKNRLKMKIKLLANPYDVDYIKMKGENDVFRTRLGDYRILFLIQKNEQIVSLLKLINEAVFINDKLKRLIFIEN